VSEPAPRFGVGTVFAAITLVAGVSVLVKALLLEQPLGMRTLILATVAGAGALLAVLPLATLATLVARRWPRWLRGGLAAVWMAAAFAPATMLAFAIENRMIEGRVEADSVTDLGARDLFWSLFGGMGLFTPTGLAYLLPWPLLMVALTAFVCFYRWPAAARSPA
jgi:hypothetical protein